MGGSKSTQEDSSTGVEPSVYYDEENQVCLDPSSGRGNAFMQEQLSGSEQGGDPLDQTVSISSSAGGIPPQLIPGIIHYETADRGMFEGAGEAWKKLNEDWTVSLGPADIQVRRAAEVLHPGRNWSDQPLTSQEFDDIVAKLESMAGTEEILTKALQADYDFYGKKPGKSEEDRWRFAVAKHKGGHGVVGSAQQAVLDAGGDANKWSEVAEHMDGTVVRFVENVWSFSPP